MRDFHRTLASKTPGQTRRIDEFQFRSFGDRIPAHRVEAEAQGCTIHSRKRTNQQSDLPHPRKVLLARFGFQDIDDALAEGEFVHSELEKITRRSKNEAQKKPSACGEKILLALDRFDSGYRFRRRLLVFFSEFSRLAERGTFLQIDAAHPRPVR